MTDFQAYLNNLAGQQRTAILSDSLRTYSIHTKDPTQNPLTPNAIWDDGEKLRFQCIEHMADFDQTVGEIHEVNFQNDVSVRLDGDWLGSAWVHTFDNTCYDKINDPTGTSSHGTHNTYNNTGHFATTGNVSMSGGRSFNDLFRMGGGNDWVESKTGNDTVYGGGGDDYIDGGTGNDKLYGDVGIDFLFGGIGDDHLDGGSYDDYLSGDAGNDTLLGDTGDDYLTGGDGADSLDGGIGRDYLIGGADNDSLFGGSEDDTLSGGDGNDNVDGGAGNDSMTGGAGDDAFNGDLGSDTMFGNSGNDTFLYTPGFGVDWIAEGAGVDEGTMDMAYIVGTTDAFILKNGNNLILGFDNDNMVVLNNWYVDQGVEYVYFADADALYTAADLASIAEDVTPAAMARSASNGFNYTMSDLSSLETVPVDVAGVAAQLELAHSMI